MHGMLRNTRKKYHKNNVYNWKAEWKYIEQINYQDIRILALTNTCIMFNN